MFQDVPACSNMCQNAPTCYVPRFQSDRTCLLPFSVVDMDEAGPAPVEIALQEIETSPTATQPPPSQPPADLLPPAEEEPRMETDQTHEDQVRTQPDSSPTDSSSSPIVGGASPTATAGAAAAAAAAAADVPTPKDAENGHGGTAHKHHNPAHDLIEFTRMEAHKHNFYFIFVCGEVHPCSLLGGEEAGQEGGIPKKQKSTFSLEIRSCHCTWQHEYWVWLWSSQPAPVCHDNVPGICRVSEWLGDVPFGAPTVLQTLE